MRYLISSIFVLLSLGMQAQSMFLPSESDTIRNIYFTPIVTPITTGYCNVYYDGPQIDHLTPGTFYSAIGNYKGPIDHAYDAPSFQQYFDTCCEQLSACKRNQQTYIKIINLYHTLSDSKDLQITDLKAEITTRDTIIAAEESLLRMKGDDYSRAVSKANWIKTERNITFGLLLIAIGGLFIK